METCVAWLSWAAAGSPSRARTALTPRPPTRSIDVARLNVHGGSLGAGHPFGATGGRIVASLAKTLSERAGGTGFGVISVCAAGGLGVTAIMEGPGGGQS
jgi:acetyl-CoA C-acetyltransferase